jgi:hypothetical protein
MYVIWDVYIILPGRCRAPYPGCFQWCCWVRSLPVDKLNSDRHLSFITAWRGEASLLSPIRLMNPGHTPSWGQRSDIDYNTSPNFVLLYLQIQLGLGGCG